MLSSQKMMSEQSAGGANYIDDVFSTYLYTGNGSSQVIENGINLGTSNSGGSAYFDGSGDQLTVADATALQLQGTSFTIEGWFYASSFNGSGGVTCLASNYGGSSAGWYIQIDNAGTALYAGLRGDPTDISASVTVNTNAWNHIALSGTSGSSSSIKLYLNGNQVGSTYTGSSSMNSGGAQTTIAALYAGSYVQQFGGNISNFRIVKGTALYTGSTYTVPTSALTAISGTSLLVCQGDAPFTDNSTNAFTITRNGDVAAKGFGPFTSATAGEGGLVWIKARDSISASLHHNLWDTVRGNTKRIFTSLTNGESTDSPAKLNFNSDGFSLASDYTNTTDSKYVSWTFRKQPKFFDVVTYTGNGGTQQNIAHSLGAYPGFIVVKRTDAAGDWYVCPLMQSNWNNDYLVLNSTAAKVASGDIWQGTSYPSTTTFGVLDGSTVNISGATYVAYLFAASGSGGFGATGTDNVISCGSFTTNSSGQVTVNLGYEPQWIMIKKTSSTGNWITIDNMRGWTSQVYGFTNTVLYPNSSSAENTNTYQYIAPTSTGFENTNSAGSSLGASSTYIYIAIRRPMKPPTTGTEVFNTAFGQTTAPGFQPNIVTDSYFMFYKPGDPTYPRSSARLIGNKNLQTSSTAAENTDAEIKWDYQNGTYVGAALDSTFVAHCFRRAPEFFDVVCFNDTGSSGTVTVPHNLGVVPELLIQKYKSHTSDWYVYHQALGTGNTIWLNYTDAADPSPTVNSLTASSFTLDNRINATASRVAYLFATVAGVSKVGSYTGTGSTQQINCGFSGGARFVMIKRTDSTGDWYVWDTARGIVSGNDPYLRLNSTGGEVTNTDYIDPYSAGFEISSTAPAAINANGGSYIYLAIA